jgi:hypothetical protein
MEPRMAHSRSPSLDTVRQRSYWRDADARVIVDAWRRSGQTRSAFATEHDLDPRRLRRWIARLAGSPKRAVRFHPVRVVPPPVESAPPPAGAPAVEVLLPNGYVVRVSPQIAAGDLHAVLALLRDAPRC